MATGVFGVEPDTSLETNRSVDPGAGGDAFPEYKIKAAFLYNFIRYTTWPAEALGKKEAPIELMVVGKDPFGPILAATFRDKKLHGRSVVIRHVKDVPKKLTAHLVFACGLDEKQKAALIKACTGLPILLIGDESGFAEQGASASFLVQRNKVRFEVNNEVTKAGKLTISSQLLKLATIVKTKGEKR